LAALSDATHWLLGTFREWQWRSREFHQLAGLNDRMLRDIGIACADAIYISSKAFWRE
jgi:uncharacterized protein YjiS (DUF1127 family)